MTYKKPPFTLIQMLVVVAIIAILAAILLPALQRAKIAARKAVCLSQLRQFVMAAHVYSDDNEGKFPVRVQANGNYSFAGYPHEMNRKSNYKYNLNPMYIKPYISKSNQIMFCPGQNFNGSLDNVAYTTDDIQWSTYQYLVWGVGAWFWKVPQPDFTLPDKISNPNEAPIWSCKLQDRKGVLKPTHPNSTSRLTGHNASMSDGSSRWVEFQDTEVFWAYGTDMFYWPIYRED